MGYNQILNYLNYRNIATNTESVENLFTNVNQRAQGTFSSNVKPCNVTADLSRAKIKAPFKFLLPCAYKNTDFLAKILGVKMDDIDGIVRGRLYVLPSPNSNAFDGNWKIIDIGKLNGVTVDDSKFLTYGNAFEYMLSRVNPQELLLQLQTELKKWALNYVKIKLSERIKAVEFVIKNKVVLTDLVTDRIVVIPAVYNVLALNLPTLYYPQAVMIYVNAVTEFNKYLERTDKRVYSKILQFSACRIIYVVEGIFEFFNNSGITFKNNLLLAKDFLKKVSQFELSDTKNGVKVVLPIMFEKWDKPLEIYISEKAGEYLLSDNGYVFEYLDEFCDYDYIKDENKFDDFCQKNSVNFENHHLTMQIKVESASAKSTDFYTFLKTLIAIISYYEIN